MIDKLKILADSAKYDAACTSSGVDRKGGHTAGIGNAASFGICHSFAADGRCISLLKILMTKAYQQLFLKFHIFHIILSFFRSAAISP